MYAELGNLDESPFYTDVIEAGGLAQAIQAQLKAIASSLRVKKGIALFPFAHA